MRSSSLSSIGSSVSDKNDSGNIALKDSSTQTQELFEEYEYIGQRLTKWLTTMDGGCNNEETSKKASSIIKNMLNELTLIQVIDSTTVCD